MGSAPATRLRSLCSIRAAPVLSSPPGVPWYSSNWAKRAPKPSTTGVSDRNGISACNAPQKFVLDTRGTSPFFAAWRSLVFQQLGEAGAQALYHWGFGTDQQYGEVDASGNPFFSYWVDYYLSHWLPSPPGQDILQTTTTGCCVPGISNGWLGSGGLLFDTQTMAARNPDGSVVILMSNYALQAASGNQANYDNNGPGSSRTFALDLSALGTFASATLVTLDASTPASP